MDKQEYECGYRYICVNIGAPIGIVTSGDNYFEKISYEINRCRNAINSKKGSCQGIAQQAGYIAELWHAGTYNINAAVHDSTDRANVLGSHDFASVDVQLDSGNSFNLKYHKDSNATLKAISMRYEEYYRKHRKEYETFEDFYKKRGIDVCKELKNTCIYSGQYGLVPADQYEKLLNDLKRIIATEKTRRPEIADTLVEVINTAVDRIYGPNGVESVPLSKKQAEDIAKLAGEGLFNPEDYGFTLDLLVDYKKVFGRAIEAGTDAALISAIMRVIPYLISSIKKADSDIDWEDFAEKGLDVLTSSGKSFVVGSFAAAINDICKKKEINIEKRTPEVIGALVAMTISVMEEFIKVSLGKEECNTAISNCVQNICISLSGLVGSLLLPEIPIGIVIGNILGCLIGGFVYNATNTLFLSLCAESGFSCFGLVEQDYSLPDYILKDMGFDLMQPDLCTLDEVTFDECIPDMCEPEENEFDLVQPYFIKRGIIGINRIGYIFI